jgi:hypothetical protein
LKKQGGQGFERKNIINYILSLKKYFFAKKIMPTLSMFYGLVIYMYAKDNQKHHTPHIHAEYQNDEAVFSILDGKLLEGKLPNKKIQLVKAWIIINHEDLMANWILAMKGNTLFKIKPLS